MSVEEYTSKFWIQHLDLEPHPEGGYYKEVFSSKICVARDAILQPKEKALTSIYYLLEGQDFSSFHRLTSDEIWYFHKGSAATIHVINGVNGALESFNLSDAPSTLFSLSAVIKANSWFAAEIPSKQGFCLVSCAVAPGFRFENFEIGQREGLLKEFPQHAELIRRLSR